MLVHTLVFHLERKLWTAYFTILCDFVEHFCACSQETNTQRIQNHPLAPPNDPIRQVVHLQAVNQAGEALCDRLQREEG